VLPILVILAFSVLYVHDGMRRPLLDADASAWAVVIGSVSPMLTLVGGLWLAVLAMERRVSRYGRVADAMLAERLVAYSRPVALAVYASGVLGLGLPRAVRAILGDVVFFDEFVCLLPLCLAWFAGWWIIFPIERRVREAAVLRNLDAGRPVYPFPRRARFAWVSFRTQVLFFFLPLSGLMAWTEASYRLIGMMPWSWREGWREPLLVTVAHLIGVAGVVLAMPLALRFVWDTAALGDSPLTRRLQGLCAMYRVRVRRLLVWRTDGVVVNGAVVGVVPPFRYILLTDALLDQLPTWQIEAVTAHEVAHVRCRHMGWLAVCVLAGVFGAGVAGELLIRGLTGLDADGEAASGIVLCLTLGVLFVVFGGASRVFERQADAFAARHMSAAAQTGGAGDFTEAGVGAMADALRNVAMLNGAAPDRFTWRHGSINQRVEHLRSLIGVAWDAAPVDRAARRVKRAALTALIVGVVVMFLLPGVR
jgi:STE24 endopeptidase